MARSTAARPLDLVTTSAVSLAAHATGALVLVAIVRLATGGGASTEAPLGGAGARTERAPAIVEIELDGLEPGEPAELVRRAPSEDGGAARDRPDTGRRGRGGERHGERAQNLAPRAQDATRSASVWSHPDRSQLSRLETGRVRRSFEDWRASRAPGFDDHLALGRTGPSLERRPEGPAAPSAGERSAATRPEEGSVLGAERATDEGPRSAPPGYVRAGHQAGARDVVRWAGLAGARGEAPVLSAPAGEARPLVEAGLPSVAASDRGRPSDTTESAQRVATRAQTLLETSAAGGEVGAGRGGEPPGPGRGAGGERDTGFDGRRAGQGGVGAGRLDELGYVRAMQARIHPLWADAFPKWAIAEGRSGHAIVRVVVGPAGQIEALSIVRRSGVEEFDAKVKAAVRRAAPFGPLPAALAPRLVVHVPFVAKNPAVRPIVP